LPVSATTQPPRLTVVSARAAMPLMWVPLRMSTRGFVAGAVALVLGTGDAVVGVTAGADVAGGGGVAEVDATAETGGADVGASAGEEAAGEEAGGAEAGDEADGFDPAGVAPGET
jgi:hypothetical protein